MALLISGVDYYIIKLMGRWSSDKIMAYLHISARPLLQLFSSIMVDNGYNAQIPAPAELGDLLTLYPFTFITFTAEREGTWISPRWQALGVQLDKDFK